MQASESTAAARFVALATKLARRAPGWNAAERRRRRAKVSCTIVRNKIDVLSDYVTSDYDSGDNTTDTF